MLKRKRPELSGVKKALTPDEQAVYNIIKSKTNMGISKLDLKRALTMRDRVFNSCIKSLQTKSKIKEVKSVKNKKGHLMAMEFEPSNELTGGVWYSEGQLDTDFIEKLMKICMAMISKRKVATAEQVAELVMESGALNVNVPVDQIKEILKTLVLDGEVVEVKSTGFGEYALIPDMDIPFSFLYFFEVYIIISFFLGSPLLCFLFSNYFIVLWNLCFVPATQSVPRHMVICERNISVDSFDQPKM